jgi:diguanylate cyclase (GGDEF)-like protein/PAS domain S-box-containing protein
VDAEDKTDHSDRRGRRKITPKKHNAIRDFRKRPRAFYDLVVLAILAVTVFVLSAALNINQTLEGWARGHGPWLSRRIDEWAIVFVVLAFGFGVFSLRRWNDLRADIAERKRLEGDLIKFKLGIERSGEAIFIADREGTLIYVNPAFEKIYGFSREDVLGKTPRILKSGTLPPEVYQQFWDTILAKKVMSGEIINKTKDGRLLYAYSSANPILNEAGDIIGFLAIQRDITESKRMEEALRALSLVDELTGLYNRRGFVTLAQQQLKLANRLMRKDFLVFVDLDHMKWINDTLGHRKGDEALVEAADILKNTFRESDIVARIGGDEFAILTVETEDADIEAINTRLQGNIKDHQGQGHGSFTLSMSVGITRYDPEHPCSIDELLAKADKLMYEQKRDRKGPSLVAGVS